MSKVSDFKLALFIGARYARSRRGNRFVSFLTLFSGMGIALGVAVLIIVMSVMNGFESELHTRILGMVTHVTVKKADDEASHNIESWQRISKQIANLPYVEAVAPVVRLEGMLSANGVVTAVEINGVLPEMEKEVSIFPSYMLRGDVNLLEHNPSGIIVGSSLSQKLALNIGDNVTFVFPEVSTNHASVIIPRFKQFELLAVFSTGSEYDQFYAATHIETLGSFLHKPGLVSGLRLKLLDLYEAPTVKREIQSMLGERFEAQDWSVSHGNFFRAVSLEKSMMGVLLLLIVAIAAFNIVSSLIMLVADKTVDIAILRTLGATNTVIIQVFMIQGMLVGIIGVIFGGVTGVIIAGNLGVWVARLEDTLNVGFLDLSFLKHLPSKLEWPDVFVVFLSALVMAFLATVYPARKAADIEPVEAFHYD